MTAKMTPYLNFAGITREAMTFYHDVLGGELTISTFGEFGMEGEGSDGVMHSQLVTPDDMTLMASDMPPGMPGVPANGNVSISGDDGDRLRAVFAGIGEGGFVGERESVGDGGSRGGHREPFLFQR